ncbi:MAG: efflux transporter outer membrane subunit [Desulfomicrobium sp.]
MRRRSAKWSGTWIAVVLVAVGLAGCASVGPDYAPPTPDAPAAWSALEHGGPAQGGRTGDISRWWRALNDPLLTALVDEALLANHDVRDAQARLRAARARRAVALAGFFPGLDASGSGSRAMSSREAGTGLTRENYNVGLDASWELDVFGGARRDFEAAGADLQASEASVNAAQVSLAAEVALSYVEMRSLRQRLHIAQANLASQSETLQLTRWRALAGLADSQDVAQALSSREQTRAQIPALETTLAETQHSLDILLGMTPGSLRNRLDAGEGLPQPSENIAVGIPADVLRQRPDVRAAERLLAAETARVGVAEAARYPSFTLSGSVGLEALTLGALGNSGAETWSLIGGITAPIFQAGRLRAQVEVQDAAREQALVAYEQTILEALRDVENALVSLARSGQRAEALKIAAGAARNAADMARQRYASGLVDFQPVLDAERNALSTEDSLASASADRVLALIRLYKALGGGWSPQPVPTDTDTPSKEIP